MNKIRVKQLIVSEVKSIDESITTIMNLFPVFVESMSECEDLIEDVYFYIEKELIQARNKVAKRCNTIKGINIRMITSIPTRRI